jgi:hypothetical protein
VTLELTILRRKRTSLRRKETLNLLVIQFDMNNLRLLIYEFLEKKWSGFVQRANSSRLGSSKGRVEDESSSVMSKDIDRSSRVRNYRTDDNLEKTNNAM